MATAGTKLNARLTRSSRTSTDNKTVGGGPGIVEREPSVEPLTMDGSMEVSLIDPVCGVDLRGFPPDLLIRAEHSGKAYYFCSTDCLLRFQATPEDFVRGGLVVGEEGAA